MGRGKKQWETVRGGKAFKRAANAELVFNVLKGKKLQKKGKLMGGRKQLDFSEQSVG